MTQLKKPKPSQREKIMLFRNSIIGDLLAQDLRRGELQEELKQRAKIRYRPPGGKKRRRYHWKTLQRWYYAARKDPVEGLLPQSRAKGFAQALSDEQRALLVAMRQEHPSAAVEMLRDQAIYHGQLTEEQVSLSTLRRLLAAEGLSRVSRTRAQRNDLERRRWQAANPNDLWHGDVCHLILEDEEEQRRRVLVHALLDDASRYVPALTGRLQEREVDSLEVLCGALLRHPAPRHYYLDLGACYRGDILALFCQRLGINLIHAPPRCPEPRGTMERFFRTMRQRCTDHLPTTATLHQVNQALWAWLDVDYHRRPHAGLLGETPRRKYLDALSTQRAVLTPRELAKALEVTETRLVRGDATFSFDGTVYEVRGRHLCGKRIEITFDGLTGTLLKASWNDRQVHFGCCDPIANSKRKRAKENPTDTPKTTPFNPIATLLQQAREVDDD